MDKQEILLKEYEVTEQHIHTVMSQYWSLFNVFMPVSTALLGFLFYMIWSNVSYGEWLILVLGVGVIFMLYCLKIYFHRVSGIIRICYFRMREIEQLLGMSNNTIISYLDECKRERKKLDERLEARFGKVYARHVSVSGERAIGSIFYALILMWTASIFIAFFVRYYKYVFILFSKLTDLT